MVICHWTFVIGQEGFSPMTIDNWPLTICQFVFWNHTIYICPLALYLFIQKGWGIWPCEALTTCRYDKVSPPSRLEVGNDKSVQSFEFSFAFPDIYLKY